MWKSPREQVLVSEGSPWTPRHQSYTWISYVEPGCSVPAILVDTKWRRDELTQPSPSMFLKHKIIIKPHCLGGIIQNKRAKSSHKSFTLLVFPSHCPCTCCLSAVAFPLSPLAFSFKIRAALTLARICFFLSAWVTPQILSPSDTASTGVSMMKHSPTVLGALSSMGPFIPLEMASTFVWW